MSILICMCIWKYRVSRCNFRTNTNHSFIPWRNIEITDCPLSHRRPYSRWAYTSERLLCLFAHMWQRSRASSLCLSTWEKNTTVYVNRYFDSRSRSILPFVFHMETRSVYRRLCSSNFIDFFPIASCCTVASGVKKRGSSFWRQVFHYAKCYLLKKISYHSIIYFLFFI